MKVRLTKTAIADLREAQAYVALDNPSAAILLGLKIEKAITLIAQRPTIGRPTPVDGTREWSIPGLPYVIPYRVSGEAIEIIRIWHTSRKRPTEW